MKVILELDNEVYDLLEEVARRRKLSISSYCRIAIGLAIWDDEVKRRKKEKGSRIK